MGRGINAKSSVRTLSLLALAAGGVFASTASSAVFFDWEVPPQGASTGYVGAPDLYNNASSATAVANYWAAHPSDPKAVRVIQDLSDPAALNLFRNNAVSYVFADLEGSSIATRTANLVGQVRWNPVTRNAGHVYFSHRAHVTLAHMPCRDCHGDVAAWDKPPTEPDPRLESMGACLGCHRKQGGPTTCDACHE